MKRLAAVLAVLAMSVSSTGVLADTNTASTDFWNICVRQMPEVDDVFSAAKASDYSLIERGKFSEFESFMSPDIERYWVKLDHIDASFDILLVTEVSVEGRSELFCSIIDPVFKDDQGPREYQRFLEDKFENPGRRVMMNGDWINIWQTYAGSRVAQVWVAGLANGFGASGGRLTLSVHTQ